MSNIDGRITAMCLLFDDLVGARIIRRQTLAKYLDATNFEEGNPSADPAEHFPDDVWFIERKIGEDKQMVEFELTTAIDLNGQQLPGRQIIAGMCGWLVREAIAARTAATTVPRWPTATTSPLTIRPVTSAAAGYAVKLRFGQDKPLPYGGFPPQACCALIDSSRFHFPGPRAGLFHG